MTHAEDSSRDTPQASADGRPSPEQLASQGSPEQVSVENVTDYLLYTLSLPERAVRSTSAAVGGALRESTDLLVPGAFRTSRAYEMFIKQSIDFVVQDIGQVSADDARESQQVDGFVARKAVGGFVEMAAMPLLHVSPMTVLAIVSDVAHGSKSYLHELSAELKQQGVIDEHSTIDRAVDLLDAIRETSGTSADALDTPPISLDGLSDTIEQVSEAAASIDPAQLIPQAEIERLWREMHELALQEHVSVFDMSSTMSMYAMDKIGNFGVGAISTISVAGNMFERDIIDHYSDALMEIHTSGYYATLAKTSEPYMQAIWDNFSSRRTTLTQDLLTGKLAGQAWNGLIAWLDAEDPPPR